MPAIFSAFFWMAFIVGVATVICYIFRAKDA